MAPCILRYSSRRWVNSAWPCLQMVIVSDANLIDSIVGSNELEKSTKQFYSQFNVVRHGVGL